MKDQNSPVVFFYVQHLLGIGHAFRAARVARALTQSGFKVHLIWGGTTVSNLDLTGLEVKRLTPVRAGNAEFSELVHEDGRTFTDQDKNFRKEQLISHYREVDPDILITEAFPFGRRQMRFELLPLLEAATSSSKKPLVVSSIRDIMQEGRREKAVRESLDAVHDRFDLVLVHGDPSLVRIEDTLQGAGEILAKIRYTGLVTPHIAPIGKAEAEQVDVLVSAGGGAVGFQLMEAAKSAMAFSKKFPRNWCLSAGTELPETDFQKLCEDCPTGMRIVRFLPDTLQAMQACKVSVSRSGYNTVADLLRAKCAAVLVPFTGGRETEQLKRAELMAAKGVALMIHPDELSPQKLAETVDQASETDRAKTSLQLNGAIRSAEILLAEFQLRNS